MGSAWNQLEQMLTCAICLDKFKNPRLLPCQHSFCSDACMDGLVDYARRQIKCPECRAEHRIPYQGVQSLPLNVTLIRFLELHARITGEEPEPVPTFMEKCAICGEKVEGVQRCAHCAKKVCPECKEAHVDLLRREINRINGQSKRSVEKIREFRDDALKRAEEKLAVNHATVRREIEDSCKRLMEDLQAKQRRLLEEVDSYVEQEQKTIGKLKVAIVDELDVLESNLKLADDKLTSNKFQWTDAELSECKEIYNKAMEFVRLFDPEIGDFSRKIRFNLIPEFETLRRRLCELGELKFSETALSLIANSFQYCNASGQVAVELCQAAALAMAADAGASAHQQQQMGGYGLAHSNSNTNVGMGAQLSPSFGGAASQMMLELPNSLMRSQSDHRLASQFQARLKQQEAAAAAAKGAGQSGSSAGRYGRQMATDYDNDSALRSRYAPPRSSATGGATGAKDSYSSDLLRDWPRPSDNDSDPLGSLGSSIHFKSAFMRRKEKERQQQHQQYGAGGGGGSTYCDDDDDLTSEASYGGSQLSTSGRNVRFYDNGQLADGQQQLAGAAKTPKVFDCREVVHAPLSGVPKLEECPQLNTRLHQLGAKALVDKKHADEEGQRDKDLVESARLAMSKASQRIQRQASEDEIEKQKRANAAQQPQQQQQQQQRTTTATSVTTTTTVAAQRDSGTGTGTRRAERQSTPVSAPDSGPRGPLTGSREAASEAAPPTASAADQATVGAAHGQQNASGSPSASSSPATPTSASGLPGGRRSLYGQAVTERSKRQLSNAIQEAANYTRRRSNAAATSLREDTQDSGSALSLDQATDQQQQAAPEAGGSSSLGQPTAPASSGTGTIRKRALRSGRSMSKQSSVDTGEASGGGGSTPGTPTTRRRRTLARAESSQRQSVDSYSAADSSAAVAATAAAETGASVQSKNLPIGSGGGNEPSLELDEADQQQQRRQEAAKSPVRPASGRPSIGSARASQSTTDQLTTPTTTDDEDDDDDDDVDDDQARRRRLAGSRAENTGTIRRAKAPVRQASSSAQSSSSRTYGAGVAKKLAATGRSGVDDDDEDADRDDDDDDDDDDVGRVSDSREDRDEDSDNDSGAAPRGAAESAGTKRQASGKRRSREFLPSSMNRLLDRSAQIRRDSQEQRTRADSPQRSSPGPTSSQPSQSAYSSSSSYSSARQTGGGSYSSSPSVGSGGSASAGTGQRLTYQRSQPRLADKEDEATPNSSQSTIYTTASSQSRRSSNEDSETTSGTAGTVSGRRPSSSSTDRTVISATRTTTSAYKRPESPPSGSTAPTSRYSSSSSRRDSGGDNNSASTGGYQSRFLARSRTSAALSSGGGGTSGGSSSARSREHGQELASSNQHHQAHYDTGSGASSYRDTPSAGYQGRSYLSSRDRFMQSAGVMSSSGGGTSASSGVSGYRGRSSGAASSSSSAVPLVTSMGQYRHQPSARSHFSDNSPFLDMDDDDDDYSAYFPSAASSRQQQQAAANLFRQQQQNQLLQSAASSSSLLSSSSPSGKVFKSMRPARY